MKTILIYAEPPFSLRTPNSSGQNIRFLNADSMTLSDILQSESPDCAILFPNNLSPASLRKLSEKNIPICTVDIDDAEKDPICKIIRPDLDETLTNLFLYIGIPLYNDGQDYLRAVLKKKLIYGDSVPTNRIYAEVASEISKQRSSADPINGDTVSRNIRNAIKGAYSEGKIHEIYRFFPSSNHSVRQNLTNRELFALCYRLLKKYFPSPSSENDFPPQTNA